jgi:acetate kinase
VTARLSHVAGERPQPLAAAPNSVILVINSGSSSIKFALFAAEGLSRLWAGAINRIGLTKSQFHATDRTGTKIFDKITNVPDHTIALKLLLDAVDRQSSGTRLLAVGHRVVHGGQQCDCPVLVTRALEVRLRKLNPLAPLHQPHNLAGIAAVRRARRNIPQVACFDTAFHHRLPNLARLTALPRELYNQGIRRYGFHGLSYEYIVDELRRNEIDVRKELVILAHLGNGASMCALKDGASIETTMGFSTLSGLPMGSRCGDLDPGVLLYLLGKKHMSVQRVQHLLYEESGLLGLSELSSNMEDLLKQLSKPSVAEAVEFYCYQARRQLAALTASLGGVDRLVFTGGIGANAPFIRKQICNGLKYLGIEIDQERNAEGARLISSDTGRVAIEAFATDEEMMIARHVFHLTVHSGKSTVRN